MHRKAWLSAFAALALSGTLAVAQTSDSSAPSGQQASSAQMGELHGKAMDLKVKSIDTNNNLITFEAPLAANAKIDQNGKPIALDQVKEGDQVRAAFDEKTGVVLKIDVKQSAPQEQKQEAPKGQ